MIRAIIYTTLLCCLSAGTALGLAFVHNVMDQGPEPARAPVLTDPAPVAAAPGSEPAQETVPARRVSPPPAVPLQDTAFVAPAQPDTQVQPRALPQRATEPQHQSEVAAISTRGFEQQGLDGFFGQSEPSPVDRIGEAPDISAVSTARSAPIARTRLQRDLIPTWSTGVYR